MVKINKSWLNSHLNDPFVKLAQKEGFRARSVYKLKEINETFKIIKANNIVVDLGSSPGAWSQYVSKILNKEGVLIALDLLPMEKIKDVEFIQSDFCESSDKILELLQKKNKKEIDVILSDMAPNLSGNKSTDSARIENLIENILFFAKENLSQNGNLIVKIFYGLTYEKSLKLFKENFKIVKSFKPKASRDKSSEVFLIAQTKK